MDTKAFQRTIYDFYTQRGRDFPWRKTTEPYAIFISEVMLQQTQASRVTAKYQLFIETFPDFNALANAPLKKLLSVWQGLGYNRRALALKKSAQIIVNEHGGQLPVSADELVKLPGIGPATAASIVAFAYNQPVVFIETNIRSVYLHFYFEGRTSVADNEILPIIEKTLDRTNPRIWYYALMDYGVMLKKTFGNPSRNSRHYRKQSTFQGSNRQIRGKIIKLLTDNSGSSLDELKKSIGIDPGKLIKLLAALEKEGFIVHKDDRYFV